MSSLKITYDELQREIGRFLGYSRTPTDWDTTESQDVADIIRGGLRGFYFPSEAQHRWSFLCPTVSLDLLPGTREYELPEDFVGFASSLTFSQGDDNGRLSEVDSDEMRTVSSNELLSGTPKYFALSSKAQSVDRYEITVYPTPDKAATLRYSYQQEPAELSNLNPLHLGSAAHSELVLASCLMVADRMLNKEGLDPTGGLYAARYISLLKSSISVDGGLVTEA